MGFTLVCDGCSEEPLHCENCSDPFCLNCEDGMFSHDLAFCDIACANGLGYFMCESGELHSQDDAEEFECEDCCGLICTDCESYEECSDCSNRYCSACFDSEEHEACSSGVTTTHPTTPATNNTQGGSNAHTKVVNGKDQCFCDDPNKTGSGHLPGGIFCRVY